MSVEVRFTRRLGNNLFQYCLGRIIAEAHGYELNCTWPGPPASVAHHVKTSGSWATLPGLAQHFPNAPLQIPGTRIVVPEERYVIGERNWSGQGIPIQSILAKGQRRFVLCGFFQRIEYYQPHQASIRRWLLLDGADSGVRPDPSDVVVSIRRGLDYYVDGWVLKPSYYSRALEALRPRRTYVCGVGIDDTVKRALAPFDPIYYRGSPIEEFDLLMRFRKVILSNSTFAWWAGWLSDAEQIAFPRCRCYWGDEFPDVDLEVDESRYLYFDDVETEEWRPFIRNTEAAMHAPAELNLDHLLLSASPSASEDSQEFPVFALAAFEWIRGQQEPFGEVDLLRFLPVCAEDADETFNRRQLRRLLRLLVKARFLDADALGHEWLERR